MQFHHLQRGYYNNQDPHFVRRGESGPYMPLSQTYPLDSYDTSSQSSQRATPASDADKTGAAARKRVPVACERCRKRKIKCSGDDEGSCTNCRNAGLAGSCQFLRVASIDGSTLMRNAMNQRVGWPVSHRYSPYSLPVRHNHSQSAYSPYGQHLYSSQALQNGVDCSYPIASQNSSWSRSAPYLSPYSPYDEQPAHTYATQSGPSFLLPNSDPMANGTTYPVHPYTRTNVSQLLQDPSVHQSSSQSTSHLLTTPYTVSPYEIATSYPAVTMSLSSALKHDQTSAYQTIGTPQTTILANSERVLPNPSRQFSLNQFSTLDSLPMSAGARSHRSSIGWTTDTSSCSSHISSQTSCSSAGGYTEPSGDRYSSNRDTQELSCNYLGAPISPAPNPATSLSASVSEAPASHNSLISSVAELDQHPRCRTVSQESVHQEPSTPISSYGYNGNTMARHGSVSTPSAHLTNGATYSRAQSNLTTRREPSTEEYSADFASCPSVTSRDPIAAISNLARY